MTAKTFSKLLVLSCSLFFLFLPPASARGRGGAVFIGGGFYDPFLRPYPYYSMYDQGPAVGTVKFDTADRSAAVYIEGGYAGTVGDLKNLRLQPGTYSIELRPANNPSYTAKVYVGAGKTVHVNPTQRP